MSYGPTALIIKQVGDLPAACLPMKDANGDQPVQIYFVGVSHARGPTESSEIYWAVDMSKAPKPVYLKRGECLVYGENIDGARTDLAPKTLRLNYNYGFAIRPGGKWRSVYGASFCVLKQPNGKLLIVVPTAEHNPCPDD